MCTPSPWTDEQNHAHCVCSTKPGQHPPLQTSVQCRHQCSAQRSSGCRPQGRSMTSSMQQPLTTHTTTMWGIRGANPGPGHSTHTHLTHTPHTHKHTLQHTVKQHSPPSGLAISLRGNMQPHLTVQLRVTHTSPTAGWHCPTGTINSRQHRCCGGAQAQADCTEAAGTATRRTASLAQFWWAKRP